MKRETVAIAIVLIALGATAAGQSQPRKNFTGGRVTLEDQGSFLKLDEMGMPGVTHMMMLDRRNLEIADLLLNWAGRNVTRRR